MVEKVNQKFQSYTLILEENIIFLKDVLILIESGYCLQEDELMK